MIDPNGDGYDGVILGSGALAVAAALRLSRSRRVAVVAARSRGDLGALAAGLVQAAAARSGAAWAAGWGWGNPATATAAAPLTLPHLQRRSRLLAQRAFAEDDWAIAAAAGADVTLWSGDAPPQFDRDRRGRPILTGAGRQWRSPYYLLLEDAPWETPPQSDGDGIPWATPADLTPLLAALPMSKNPQDGQEPRDRHWLIVGGTPEAITLAQALARLGATVTLAVAGRRLLPTLAWDLERPLRSLLTAEGVTLALNSPVDQGQPIQGQPWLQKPVDALLWATGRQPRDRWNLAKLGVMVTPTGIAADRYLRTAHPALRVAGSYLGGWDDGPLAQAELTTAIAPLLGRPIPPMDYGLVPQILRTDPPLAQVGHTPATARRHWGDRVRLHRYDLGRAPLNADRGHGIGWQLLISGPGGRILGACALGLGADAWIHAIAIALGQSLTLRDLDALPGLQITAAAAADH